MLSGTPALLSFSMFDAPFDAPRITPTMIPARPLLLCPYLTVKHDGTDVQMPDCELRSEKSAGVPDASARRVQKPFRRCFHRDRRSVRQPAIVAAWLSARGPMPAFAARHRK